MPDMLADYWLVMLFTLVLLVLYGKLIYTKAMLSLCTMGSGQHLQHLALVH